MKILSLPLILIFLISCVEEKEITFSDLDKRFNTEVLLHSSELAQIGNVAPIFEFSYNGRDFRSIRDYRGKVVVLDFWATWCATCRITKPYVKDIFKSYQNQDFELIGVSLDNNVAYWRKHCIDENLDWLQIYDGTEETSIGDIYKVKGIPNIALIDKEGVLVGYYFPTENRLKEKIEELLGK